MSLLQLTPESRARRFDFLTRRQGGIGGSDMAPIFGLSDYKNALDIYHEKTRPIREEDIEDDNIHQLRGHTFEEMAVAHYWAHTSRRGRRVSGATRHPDFPNVVVSLDFEIFQDQTREEEWSRGTGVGETKAPVAGVFRSIREKGPRDAVLIQLQTNIAVARREWGSFNYFNMEDKDGPTLVVDQPLDADMGSFLLTNGQRFWDEHVVPRIAPDPEEWRLLAEKEAPDIKEVGGDLKMLPNDDGFAADVRQMLEAKDVADLAEKNYRRLQDAVFQAVRDQGIHKARLSQLARLTVVTKKGRAGFDKARLADHLPLDRDKVERWLDYYPDAEIPAADVGRLLFDCVLDLDIFRTEGQPSQHLLAAWTDKE